MNEFYLELLNIDETQVANYHENGKLKVLCIYIIRGLYRNRKRVKKNKNSSTSNLNEMNGNRYELFLENQPGDDINEVNEYESKQVNIEQLIKESKALDIVKDEIFNSMNRFYRAKDPKDISANDFDIAVFVCAQNESINAISKRTKINRISLTASKHRAELKLKRLILK